MTKEVVTSRDFQFDEEQVWDLSNEGQQQQLILDDEEEEKSDREQNIAASQLSPDIPSSSAHSYKNRPGG